MSLKNRVRNSNPIAFSVIRNSKRKNELSHAYLISADPKVDTSMVSVFLIQSIVCEIEGVLSCGECSSCKKIINAQYIDLKIIDGTTGIIKKEQVISALNALQQKAMEKNGKKILYIKSVDAANVQSINSLLKFIEEPQDNTYIIMSTNNINDVLSTIKSRSQIIKLKPKMISELTDEIISKGVAPKFASILANIFVDANEALEAYNGDFAEIYKEVKVFMDALLLEKKDAPILFKKYFTKKSNFKIYLEILNIYLNDIWRYRVGQEIYFKDHESIISKYSDSNFDFSQAISNIWEFKKAIKFNGNFDLAKEKFIIKMMEA